MTERSKEQKKLDKLLLEECKQYSPDVEKIRALLKQGADPDYYGSFGSVLAKVVPNIEVVQILLASGAKPQRGLSTAIELKNHAALKMLIENGACVNLDHLLSAIDKKDKDAVRILLDAGVKDLEALYKTYNSSYSGPVINRAIVAASQSTAEIQKMVAEAVEKLKLISSKDPTIVDLQRQITGMAAEITTLRKEVEELKNPQPKRLNKKPGPLV